MKRTQGKAKPANKRDDINEKSENPKAQQHQSQHKEHELKWEMHVREKLEAEGNGVCRAFQHHAIIFPSIKNKLI